MSAEEHPAGTRSTFDVMFYALRLVHEKHRMAAGGIYICTCLYRDDTIQQKPDFDIFEAWNDHISVVGAATLKNLDIEASTLGKAAAVIKDRLMSYADFQESLGEAVSPAALREYAGSLAQIIDGLKSRKS
jgi:hypothetical protein